MTISSADREITSVNLTCTANNTSKYGPGNFSGTGYTYSGKVGTWTGSSKEISLTASAQVRMTQIEVTLAAAEAGFVSAPTISPADGTNFDISQEITITPADAAHTVWYTTDESEPAVDGATSTKYTTPFVVDATTTVKAIAVDADGNASAVASATYTKLALLQGIAGIKTIVPTSGSADFIATLDGAVVTAVNGSTVYLQDGEAGIQYYKSSHGLAVGDKISGRVSGTATMYNGLRQLSTLDLTEATKESGAAVPAPIELTVSQLNGGYEQYENMLVVVKEATVSAAFNNRNGEITQGGEAVVVRAANTSITMDANNTVNVTGYPGKYNSTIQLNVLVQENIEVLSGKETPTISFANATVSMEVGQKQTITATTDGPALTYSSSDETVVTVNATTGEVEALKGGSATITASSAEDATYYAASASYTITVVSDEMPEGLSALVAEKDGVYYALQAVKGSANNTLDAEEIHVVGDKAVITSMDALPLTAWNINAEAGTIQSYGTGQYVKAASGNANLSLSTDKCVWTWDAENKAFVLGTRTILYKVEGFFKNYAASNITNKDYSTYAHPYTLARGYVQTVTADKFGTICLPYAVAAGDLSGATVYEPIAKRTVEGTLVSVVLAEVTALEAGKAYFICGTADQLVAAYNGTAAKTPVAGALTGTFDGINTTQADGANELTGKYMLSNNVLRPCGNGCWLSPNRAYLDVELLPEATAEVRGIELGFEGALTGINGVESCGADGVVDVFTLSGVRVRAAVPVAEATKGLPVGAYVVGTKKIIVK